MSLLVRRPGLPLLMMVGDVTYDAHLLEAGHVPGRQPGAPAGSHSLPGHRRSRHHGVRRRPGDPTTPGSAGIRSNR